MDRLQLIADWEDGISPALAGFEVIQHPSGVALDYSVDSFRGLEAQALLLFSGPDEVLEGPEAPIVRAICCGAANGCAQDADTPAAAATKLNR